VVVEVMRSQESANQKSLFTSAAGRRETPLKAFKDFYLNTKAIIHLIWCVLM